MKDRVITFGDAIVAIIITIMVLAVPIELKADGDVNLWLFFKTIGIYFISYCFVANIWFETVYSFNQVKKIRNREIITYMMLLFLLSIVPSATRLLIEDTARETVLIYGALTLVVTMVAQGLNIVLTKQWVKNANTLVYYVQILRHKLLINIGFRLALLVFGYFSVQPALIIYLFLSVIGLMQNVVEREENGFINSLASEDQLDYFKERDRLWGAPRKRQLALLKNSFQDEEASTQSWVDFMNVWQKQINTEILEKQKLLDKESIGIETSLGKDVRQLEHQRDRLIKHKQEYRNRKQRLLKRGTSRQERSIYRKERQEKRDALRMKKHEEHESKKKKK